MAGIQPLLLLLQLCVLGNAKAEAWRNCPGQMVSLRMTCRNPFQKLRLEDSFGEPFRAERLLRMGGGKESISYEVVLVICTLIDWCRKFTEACCNDFDVGIWAHVPLTEVRVLLLVGEKDQKGRSLLWIKSFFLPSLRIFTLRHFVNRQDWHWFLLDRSTTHLPCSLHTYSKFLGMTRLSN